MASKYAKVIEGLSNLPPAEDDARSEVERIKSELRANETHTPESLAKRYSEARRVKIEMEEALSKHQKLVTALEEMIVASWDADETGWGLYGASPNAVKLASGASVRVDPEPVARVEDKEAFRQWCVKNGLERSLQLWPSTTASITKERLLAGAPPPDGVKAFVRYKVVWNK